MPSPYSHVIAGITVSIPYWATMDRMRRHKEDIATLMVFSVLPDLDAIPGAITGNMVAYHNQYTHSILFGLLVCLAYSAIRWITPAPRPFMRTLSLAAAAYGLHLLMDYFTYGRGLMLFWPFTNQRFAPPFVIFYGFRHSDGIFSMHHVITFLTESITMLPVLGIVWILYKRKQAKHPTTFSHLKDNELRNKH